MNEIVDSLKKIGLSEKEARIYLALLRIGESTVKEIANAAEVKRPTTYLALEELRMKGLILKIPHAKKAVYLAKTPGELYDFATENINVFKRALPKIESLVTERNPVKTLYFEGLQGIKDALRYRIDDLEGKTMTVFWAKLDKISKPVLDVFEKVHSSFIKRRIKVTGITPQDETAHIFKQSYPESLYDVDMLPQEDYSSDISLEVGENFLRIIDGVEMKSVIIEDKNVADALRQILGLVRKGINKDKN